MGQFKKIADDHRAKTEVKTALNLEFSRAWNDALQDVIRPIMQEAESDLASDEVYIEDDGESIALMVGLPEDKAKLIRYSPAFASQRVTIEISGSLDKTVKLETIKKPSVSWEVERFLRWALKLGRK